MVHNFIYRKGPIMTKTEEKEFYSIYNKIKIELKKAKKNKQNIGYAFGWLAQLRDSVLEKDYKLNNSAYIWFKNARRSAKVFKDIWDDINGLTSYIYI